MVDESLAEHHLEVGKGLCEARLEVLHIAVCLYRPRDVPDPDGRVGTVLPGGEDL